MKGCKRLLILVLLFASGLTGCSNKTGPEQNKESTREIGVVVGTFDDTWRTSVRNQLYELAQKNSVNISIWGADNSQDTENKKIDEMISRKPDVLIVNLVDSASAGNIIAKAKKADIPIIFFNIEPSNEDLNSWNKVYYVGAVAEKSGTLQGQLLADYFKENPVDDAVIDYVMIKGPTDHQDAILRTKYSVKALEDAGLKVNELDSEIADWDREKSKDTMEKILAKEGNRIDCVIANNDDMALGAIDALKNNGYFTNGRYMPVVGVDATSSAVHAIKNGTLLGTVLNDAVNQGKAIYNLADILSQGKEPDSKNCGFQITDGKIIWVDYKMITGENTADAN